MKIAAKDIAAALGVTPQAIDRRIAAERWPYTEEPCRGGRRRVFHLADLPGHVQQAVLAWLARQGQPAQESAQDSAMPDVAPAPAAPQMADTSHLTERQRSVMAARLALLRQVERLVAAGARPRRAMETVVRLAETGQLPDHVAGAVATANGKGRGLSLRSLQRWWEAWRRDGELALAPARPPAPGIPPWAPQFLSIYQSPTRPSLADAYRQVFGVPPAPGAPSIWAVRRFMSRLTPLAREEGRRTGNSLRGMLPYRRRDTSHLWPTDIYTMDGTTLDAEVKHPNTGQPWKPEVTLVIDVATRRCVGVGIAVAESAMATLDALRMACLYGGVPAMVYADNGSGYANALWTDQGTGIMARLGIELRHSIPGRPQGKGLMERALRSICVDAARRLPTCTHPSADPDARKAAYRITRAALRQGRQALPSWEDLKAALLARIEEYNRTPHRGLPRFVDPSGRRRHYSPDEYWQACVAQGWSPTLLPEAVRAEIFFPGERRTVRRGCVRILGGEYSHDALAELHGEVVEVRYDIWDSGQVQVYSLAGERLCTASLHRATPYYQPSVVEAARHRRRAAQLRRLEAKAQRVHPGARLEVVEPACTWMPPAPAIDAPVAALTDSDGADTGAPAAARPIFLGEDARYRWLMTHRDQASPEDEAWLARYAASQAYQDLADRYAFEGIAYREDEAQIVGGIM